MAATLRINRERFLRNLTELGQIGLVPEADGGGLDRRPFSSAERSARDYFRREAEMAGLTVAVDSAANLSARLPDANQAAKTLLTGSHLDTVPHGGRFDGALGVVSALEVLRTVHEAGLALGFHLEAIAFTDEEGRLGELTGSQLLAGCFSAAQVEHFLTQAALYPEDLAAMCGRVPGGLAADAMLAAKRDLSQIAAFVEVHIEQGPQLEHAGVTIGIVDAIFGRRSYSVRFAGRSDHAGTTPMNLRADALVAASRFVAEAYDLGCEFFPSAVITCGNVKVAPGVYNVVPNSAIVSLEFRAAHASQLDEMDQALRSLMSAAAHDGVTVSSQLTSSLAPRSLTPSIQTAVRTACGQLGHRYGELSSGALHDAYTLAPFVPTGMIFAPSIGGRSHCPDEETHADDLVAAADVLLHTILALAGVKADDF